MKLIETKKEKILELWNNIGDLSDKFYDVSDRAEKRKNKIAEEIQNQEKELNNLLEFDVYIGEFDTSWYADGRENQWVIKKHRAKHELNNDADITNRFIILDRKYDREAHRNYKLDELIRLTEKEVIEDIIAIELRKELKAKEAKQLWEMRLLSVKGLDNA